MFSQKVISDVDILANELASLSRGIVSIDGYDGTGKSTLAKSLCLKLQAVHIEVDNFLDKNKGGYLDHLRYTELATAITTRSATDRLLLVDGVCVRQILKTISVEANLAVYVKQVGVGGWEKRTMFEDYATPSDAIAHERALLAQYAQIEGSPQSQLPTFQVELIQYHYDFRPHERSEIVYVNRC